MIGPFQTMLRHYLNYCPDTGVFTRAVNRSQYKAGTLAGSVNNLGYVMIGFFGKMRSAHRLAWIITHGEIPKGLMIDHINGNKADNRIANLRLVTRAENGFNRHSTQAESGHIGVYRSRDRWRARIHRHGKRFELGSFDTMDEAKEAYLIAKRDMHNIKQRSL